MVNKQKINVSRNQNRKKKRESASQIKEGREVVRSEGLTMHHGHDQDSAVSILRQSRRGSESPGRISGELAVCHFTDLGGWP
jgi:hypothetical protein